MVSYTDETDKKILVAVIKELKVSNPSTDQWNAIVARLGIDGSTASGLSQRYTKKLLKVLDNGSVQGTPAGKSKGSPGTKSGKSNKRSKTMGMDDDNDETPVRVKKQKTSDIKAEPNNDGTEIDPDVSPVKSDANGDDFDGDY